MNKVIDLHAFTNSVSVPTLVLVDLQEEYLATSRALVIPNAQDALTNCKAALLQARALGFPVAFTRWTGRTFFNPATRFSGWIEGFEPAGSDSIFERNQPSCYASHHFAEVMASNNGNLVIAGFSGEVACLATAIDAFHRGHRITFLVDASASHAIENRSAIEVHDFVGNLMGLWGSAISTQAWIEGTSRASSKRVRATHGI